MKNEIKIEASFIILTLTARAFSLIAFRDYISVVPYIFIRFSDYCFAAENGRTNRCSAF